MAEVSSNKLVGVFQSANGSKYDGDWVHDKIEGYGIANYSNKNVYKGRWLRDERSGEGRSILIE